MIKFLWNTHNQIPPSSNQSDKKDELNYIWGIYHKNNSKEWINEVLNKVNFKEIKRESDLQNKDTLIIIDSSIEKKIQFYNKLKLICSKIFLFHLGDESGLHNIIPVYENCDYVWRAFCSNRYFKNNKVSCIPIGYKSGVSPKTQDKKRKYRWTFIGTPHKSSRHDLLYQLSSIKPFFCHKTEKFNEKIIEVKEMSKILSSTVFIPCPNGFVHPETYRLYEALECGCIPIVENAYKYYDRLLPNNPFIKIDKWIDSKNIIKEWDEKTINKKQEDCKKWWKNYKIELQEFIKNKIIQ